MKHKEKAELVLGVAYGMTWAIWGADKPYYLIRRHWREHIKRSKG